MQKNKGAFLATLLLGCMLFGTLFIYWVTSVWCVRFIKSCHLYWTIIMKACVQPNHPHHVEGSHFQSVAIKLCSLSSSVSFVTTQTACSDWIFWVHFLHRLWNSSSFFLCCVSLYFSVQKKAITSALCWLKLLENSFTKVTFFFWPSWAWRSTVTAHVTGQTDGDLLSDRVGNSWLFDFSCLGFSCGQRTHGSSIFHFSVSVTSVAYFTLSYL